MKIRQTATFAGLATGAAIAFAPLTTAAPTDFLDFDAINASQISSLNSFFEFGALISGVPDSAYTAGVETGGFDVLTPAGIETYAPVLTDPSQADELTPFLYFLYGTNPIEAGISTGSGSYNVLNGALIQFADSSNASLFQLFNPGEELTDDIFIGSPTNVAAALASDDAAGWFFERGVGNLAGYFGLDLSGLDPSDASSAAAAGDIDFSDVLSSQITTLNSIFDSGAALTGVPIDQITLDAGGFSTVPVEFLPVAGADVDDLTPFTYFVYGFNPIDAGLSSDPGAYNVFNGALTQFFDAYNVGLYALLSGGELVPEANYGDFLFGAEASILDAIGGDATVSSAITDFLSNGFANLAGYFDVGSLLGSM